MIMRGVIELLLDADSSSATAQEKVRAAGLEAACSGLAANYSTDGQQLCSATVQAAALADCQASQSAGRRLSSGIGLLVTRELSLDEYRAAQCKLTAEHVLGSVGERATGLLGAYSSSVSCTKFEAVSLAATVTAFGADEGNCAGQARGRGHSEARRGHSGDTAGAQISGRTSQPKAVP